MAIVKTEKISFLGKDFTKKYKCNANGMFSLDLPDEVALLLSCKSVEDKDIEEVTNKFYKKLTEYKNSERVERKIIVLDLSLKGNSINPKTKENDVRFNDWSTGSKDYCICANKPKILMECIINDNTTYYEESISFNTIHKTPRYLSNRSEIIIIEWTKEREEFVNNIIQSLRIILFQLGSFRELDSINIEKIIDQGTKLLN